MDSIRVWLEPGYDHGRTGAWLLDWPGAFTWADTRSGALARATSAAHRYVDWLASHGEWTQPVPIANVEVVEEVPARTLPDGYEINATFAADDRTVAPEELEAFLRSLAFARSDLLSVVGRVRSFQAAGGMLPVEKRSEAARQSGADDGKQLDEILRHVAGAETWFVSRLDPAARYEGPRDDLDGYLELSRQFLIDGLRRLHGGDVAPRTDSKTERWTLAKVLRRALYHSLDHMDELDRRLAVAEHRVDGLQLRSDTDIDLGQLRRLFAASGLGRRARDSDDVMRRSLIGATVTVSAWEGDSLVGFARMISDEATNGYVSTVAVAPRWQDRGLGTRVMRELMRGREPMKLVLEAREGAEAFYERLGFVRAPNAFVRPRG